MKSFEIFWQFLKIHTYCLATEEMPKQNKLLKSPNFCNWQFGRISHQETGFNHNKIIDRQISSPCTYLDPADVSMKTVALCFSDFVDTDGYKQQKYEPEAITVSFQIKNAKINDKYKTSPVIERRIKNDKYATSPFQATVTKRNNITTTTTTTTRILGELEYCVQNSESNKRGVHENFIKESRSTSFNSSCISLSEQNIQIQVNLKRKTERKNLQLNKNINYIANRINELDDIRSINNFQSQHPSSSLKPNRSRSSSRSLKNYNCRRFKKRTRSSSPYPSAEYIFPNKLLKSGDVYLPLARNSSTGFKKNTEGRQEKDFSVDKNVPLQIIGVQSENPFIQCKKKVSKFGKIKITNNEKDNIKISKQIKCGKLFGTQQLEFVVGDHMKSWQIMALEQKINNYEKSILLEKIQTTDKKPENEYDQNWKIFTNTGCGDENTPKQQENEVVVQSRRKVQKNNDKEARATKDMFIENFISSSAIPERRRSIENSRSRKPSVKALTENENNFSITSYWPQKTKINKDVSLTNQNNLKRKDASHQISSDFPSAGSSNKENKSVSKKTFSDQSKTILTKVNNKEGNNNQIKQIDAGTQVLNGFLS